MKKLVPLITLLLLAGIAGYIYFNKIRKQDTGLKKLDINIIEPSAEITGGLENIAMQIIAPSFSNGGTIPSKYTCDGENMSPQLDFSGIPEGTKSLALIADDPDAPSGVFTHWLLWNMDPKVSSIPEGSVPAGATLGKNSVGNTGYTGPCPPSGMHHYIFKIYALDTMLDVPSSADKKILEDAITGRILAKAEITGLYGRNK